MCTCALGLLAARGLSLVEASRGYTRPVVRGLLTQWLLLYSTGVRITGPVVVVGGFGCPAARGIFLDQGSNQCPLHRQADS